MNLQVSVCIPTHNRRDDLARSLDELSRLDPPPDEIVVLADGCSDDTEDFVRTQHPKVRLLVHAQARGCVVGRNVLAKAARGEVILGLDDDSYPLEKNFIARLRALFERRPKLAVASFPQRSNEHPASLTASDFGPSCFVGTYVNCAAAFRREVFLDLGGYPEFFFQAYDEPDFSLRCLEAGWEIFQESSMTVRHHFTPVQRNEIRTHQRHARNELWSVLLRCPAPQLFAVVLFRMVRQFQYAATRGWRWVLGEPTWWLAAIRGAGRCLTQRQPVLWMRYRAWMELVRKPIISEAEWNAKFGRGAS